MPQRKTTKAQYIKRRKRRKRQQRLAVVLLGLAVVFVLSILGLKALFGKLSGGSGDSPKKGATPSATSTPSPSPIPSPSPTPTPDFVSMVAVGDNLYDWYLLEDGYDREAKTFDFSHNYDYIRRYTALADFAVVNQETPLGGDGGYVGDHYEQDFFGSKTLWGSYHGFASFNTPDEAGHELVKAGFNIVTMATNHITDHGYKALARSVSFWRDNYPEVTLLGIHDSAEEQNRICIVEKYGIRLALLNYTYGLNNKSATKEASYCVDLLSEERVRKDVAKAKESADFVVVFVHWGTEYEMNALNGDQKKYTGIFLDCGVDAVIGAHPHICQTMEWKTRADGHKMVVYYSLGNFISIFKQKECNLEGMAYLEFRKNGEVKEVREGTVIPLVNHWEYSNDKLGTGVTNGKNFRVYALQDYTDGLGQTHGCLKYDKGKGFSRALMEELAKKLWGDNIKVVDWSTVTPARTAGK